MKNVLIFATIMLLSISMLKAQTTVYPGMDITTNEGNSSMFPTEKQIWIANWSPMQNYHQALIKFDLSNFSNKSLDFATLNIYQFFHAPDGSPTPFKIYAITEDWDEANWPTNQNISHGDDVYVSSVFTSSLGWYDFDVTDLVEQWIEETIPNYGLVIIANNATKFAKLYSNEADDQTKRPYLSLSFNTPVNNIEVEKNIFCTPNPATDYFNLHVKLEAPQMIHIDVFDLLGNKLKVIENELIYAGNNVKTISCNELSSGIYYVRININNNHITKKIIVK